VGSSLGFARFSGRSSPELKQILGQLVIRRAGKEIDLAMEKLRLRGDKAIARRQALTQSEVQAIIGDIEY
jgi:hypothetical protein